MVKLFFIHAESHSGDASGPDNMDLFVHADTPSEAVRLWLQHNEHMNQPDGGKVLVYDVNQLAICQSVMQWDSIPCTLHKVKL